MAEPKRDRSASLDFWRGFALLTIFINHVPGNALEPWTHKNFGFSDAAELFVLLAGISAAMAYGTGMEPGSQARQSIRILLRAWTLYMAHIVVLALCGAAIAYGVIVTGDIRLLEATQFDQIIGAPLEAAIGVATLGLQPAYLNILPLYIVLLALTPVYLRLARIGIGTLLAVAAALYVVAQIGRLTLPSYPGVDAWYFNPLTWQLLYAIGLAVGTKLGRGETLGFAPWLQVAAVAYVLIAATWAIGGFYNPYDLSPLPRFVWDFDKTNLSLPRILHVLALAVIVAALPLDRIMRGSAAVSPFVILGRQALPVFCIGTVLALAAVPVRASELGHPALDFLIIGAGIGVQFLVAWVLEWYRSGTRRTRSMAMARGAALDA